MFAFQIVSPSLIIARWQSQSVHNSYKLGLLATAAYSTAPQVYTTSHCYLLIKMRLHTDVEPDLWLLRTNFTDQLDFNFDYFISAEFQMFDSSLRGIIGTCTDSVWTHVQSQGRVNMHLGYMLMGIK